MTDGEIVLTGRHFRTAEPIELHCRNGLIAEIRPAPAQVRGWLSPGFVDIQSNGYDGQEFSSPALTVEKVAKIVDWQASFGVTRFLPTVTTASSDTIIHSVRTIAAACRQSDDLARIAVAIHVEGPYISREDGARGAHPLEHCRPPNWDEFQRFQEAADGRIRLLTLSPEYVESPEFIRRATDSGVVIALGHMAADSAQVKAAVDAGARLSTHLGNGAHRTLRRHPNYIWDQMAEDRLNASLIVDGHHLPPEVVKTIVRAKSAERCILVSDFSGLAGLPPGRYDTELCELEILPDGRLVIAGQDQLLAGASQPIGVGIAKVMDFAGVSLGTAVDMATRNPAELLGLPVVELSVGQPADIVHFDLKASAHGSELAVMATAHGQSMWTL